MLAAMCLISPLGHQLVQDGFSDSRISLGETFRFEWLISSLEAFGSGEEDEVEDESGMWEWRTAALGLINALTTSGIDLELRCDLRGEIRRRGFDHAVDVCRLYIAFSALMNRSSWTGNQQIHSSCRLRIISKIGMKIYWIYDELITLPFVY
jgi:hypothetical protein